MDAHGHVLIKTNASAFSGATPPALWAVHTHIAHSVSELYLCFHLYRISRKISPDTLDLRDLHPIRKLIEAVS